MKNNLENESKEAIIEKVKNNQPIYLELPPKWRKDNDVAMALVQANFCYYEDLDIDVKKDSNIVKHVLEKNGGYLSFMPDEIKSSKDWVIFAMKESITALYYASEELQNDKELLYMLKQKEAKVSKVWKGWFDERMDVLKIYEDEIWMKENSEKTTKRTALKKF